MRTKAKVVAVEKVWLSNGEAAKYLGVSAKTLQRYRDAARIGFYQIDGDRTIWYAKSDLDRLVKKAKVI